MTPSGQRIEEANAILATYQPGTRLYLKGHSLRMAWEPYFNYSASLRSQGDLPRYGDRHRPCGHTGMQALAQLIRYVRDLNRLPLITWEYWASETILLCNAETLRLLSKSDYGDPTKTCCVLCGTTEFAGLDWWSLDGVTGPSCRYGGCRRNRQ